jgi:hypothetical protein
MDDFLSKGLDKYIVVQIRGRIHKVTLFAVRSVLAPFLERPLQIGIPDLYIA